MDVIDALCRLLGMRCIVAIEIAGTPVEQAEQIGRQLAVAADAVSGAQIFDDLGGERILCLPSGPQSEVVSLKGTDRSGVRASGAPERARVKCPLRSAHYRWQPASRQFAIQ
ncbi:MAG: hypothetical protein EOO77_21630 [Oxalobacteraceae bacterium]|nr:MAG: hypothetical protein EOO77_21630 [Oxalobacteraceae bacterium]